VITMPWWGLLALLLLAGLGLIYLAELITWRAQRRRADRAADHDWWEGPC
jgi:CHASE1-domain containing sensor protein